ncbi:MAG: RHS repeat-associated core domain-containing protein [Verrucomicrobiales bacterium]
MDLGYGAAGSIEDLISLVKTVGIEGETGDQITYTRVGLGRFVEIAYPQPDVRMSMMAPDGGDEGDAGDPYDGFDRFGRTQAMRWEKITGGNLLDGWHWGFNRLSNRTWKKNLVAEAGQDEAYGYDGLSQVIRDALGTLNINDTLIGGIPEEEERFAYDPTGNWLNYKKDEDGSIVLDQSRTNNQDNQLTQIDHSSDGLAYDNAGNATMLRPGAGGDWAKHFELVWDAWNRLVEVKDETGASVQKNRFDGLTRRIVKTAGGVDTQYYYNDRWKCVEERFGSATTAARQYLWGERPGHRDELALRDRDTNQDGALDERLYATMDYFNGTAILDDAGAVQERYGYTAFGERRVMAPDFSVRSNSNFDWEFGFKGQFLDAETGWYNYGYRYYVPWLGRWPSRDPIGEGGGRNLYAFAKNNSINRHDRYGLLVPDVPAFDPNGDKFQGFCEAEVSCECADASEGCTQTKVVTGNVKGGATKRAMQSSAESNAKSKADAEAASWCPDQDSSGCNCPDSTCAPATSVIVDCTELPNNNGDDDDDKPLGMPGLLPNLPPPGAAPQN